MKKKINVFYITINYFYDKRGAHAGFSRGNLPDGMSDMNYTRAAEELRITQPAVSQHIAHLERVYGARLFEYRGKRLS